MVTIQDVHTERLHYSSPERTARECSPKRVSESPRQAKRALPGRPTATTNPEAAAERHVWRSDIPAGSVSEDKGICHHACCGHAEVLVSICLQTGVLMSIMHNTSLDCHVEFPSRFQASPAKPAWEIAQGRKHIESCSRVLLSAALGKCIACCQLHNRV